MHHSHRQFLTRTAVRDRAVLRRQIAVDGGLVKALGVAHISQGKVVLLGPEKRHCRVALRLPQQVARRGLPLAPGHHPMLDADAFASQCVRPARNVTRRIDAAHAGFKVFVHHHAVVHGQPRLLGQRNGRAHANAHHHQVGGQRHTVAQGHAFGVDVRRVGAQMKHHAMLFMQGLQVVSHLCAQHFFHQPCLAPDHLHFDVARAQRRCHLQTDEAGANHHSPLCALCRSHQRLSVCLGAQVMHMGQVSAGNGQAHGLGTRGQQQRAIAHAAAILQVQALLHRVNAPHARVQAQVDVVFLVKAARPQRQPIGRCRACQVIFGQVGPVAGQRGIGTEQRDRAGVALEAQGFSGRMARCAAPDDHDGRRQAITVRQMARGHCHALAGHVRLAIEHLDLPARHATQRGRTQRLAGTQAEGRVVPGAAHGVTHHQTFGQRTAVVGASGSYGKYFVAPSRQ